MSVSIYKCKIKGYFYVRRKLNNLSRFLSTPPTFASKEKHLLNTNKSIYTHIYPQILCIYISIHIYIYIHSLHKHI